MLLNESFAGIVNIGVVIIIVGSLLLGVKKGFIKQFLELLSFIVALLVAVLYSPVLARYFPIYRMNTVAIHISSLERIVNYRLNSIIWFVILFIGVSLLLIVVKLLINTLGELPVLKIFNRFLGGCFGVVNGVIIVVIISLMLSSAFFINGKEIKEKTVLPKFDIIATKVFSYVAKTLEENEAVQAFIKDPKNVSDQQRDLVEKWLLKNGYNHDDVDAVFDSINQVIE